MLPTFNLLVGSILALAFLILALAGPLALAWVLLSLRRDVHAIADAHKFIAGVLRDERAGVTTDPFHSEMARAHTVSNSAFGR